MQGRKRRTITGARAPCRSLRPSHRVRHVGSRKYGHETVVEGHRDCPRRMRLFLRHGWVAGYPMALDHLAQAESRGVEGTVFAGSLVPMICGNNMFSDTNYPKIGHAPTRGRDHWRPASTARLGRPSRPEPSHCLHSAVSYPALGMTFALRY